MSSPVVAPVGSGTPARRSGARVRILALVAVVSVVALIDSEILAYGVPGIIAGFDLLRLPVLFTYVAVGALGLATLWLTAWLVRQVWRVERELNAAQQNPPAVPPGC